MGDTGVFIIATILSSNIFRVLLSVFNIKIWGIFEPMQRDLGKISKINRRILYCIGYLLAISVSINFAIRIENNGVLSGLVLGFLMALVDICFSNTTAKNSSKT